MPEERDQLFEKALVRHLRADGVAESLCLDPETLAAYHERTLSAEELSAAKSHIVSCGRCQGVLAQLEATQKINAVRSELEPALTTAGSAPSRAMAFQEQAALVAAAAAAPLPAAAQKVTQISKKRPSLRWAVPAGAIAAGLLLWVGVREFRTPVRKSAAESVQVAENRPETPRREDSNALKDLEKQKSDLQVDKKLRQIEGRGAPALPPASRDERKSSPPADMPAFAKSEKLREFVPPRSGTTRRAPGPSAAAGQAQAADNIQNAAPGLVGGTRQSVEVTAQTPELDAEKKAQIQAPNDKTAVAGLVAGAPASAPAPPAPALARAKGQSQTGAAQGTTQTEADTQLVVTAEAPVIASYATTVRKVGLDIRIPAPGGKTIWSVGPNGQILFSKDAGRSWLAESSGVSTNLTGGSAPSNKVCWIAGANGTLLRTTDGGQHWQVLQTPIPGDLGGVHAADAQHASIWDAANRLSFETSDGGATWKQHANE